MAVSYSPGLFSREWIETSKGDGTEGYHRDSPGLFSREWIETFCRSIPAPAKCYSPGLFSREWIETVDAANTNLSAIILPAYLVGSGLKLFLVTTNLE